MLILLHLVCCLLLQSSTQPRPPAPDSQDEVIRVETSLVTLPVKVTDHHGRVVEGLKREQFRVFENGIEQELAFFEAPSQTTPGENGRPLNVALVLDTSDSTEFKLQKIQSAALAFVDLLRPADRVLVISFDKEVKVLRDLTADRDAVRESIRTIKTGGGTSLYSAMSQVVERSFARIAGPKVVILLTDGVDTTSKDATFDTTVRAAEISDAVIYPIQYDTYSDFSDNPSRETYKAGAFGAVAHVTRNGELVSEAYKRGTRYLRLLADNTAGHFQYAQSAKALARAFEVIAEQLRQQYVIGYYPKEKTNSQRKIEVKVAAPNTSVQTRKSYLYRPRK